MSQGTPPYQRRAQRPPDGKASGDGHLDNGKALDTAYPDLQILTPLKTRDDTTRMYRAKSKTYGSCMIKTTSLAPTQVEIELLKKEFHKLQLCDSPAIAKALALQESQTSLGVALVISEYGNTVEQWLQSSTSTPSLSTTLSIGIQVAQGLDHLHRHARLIHGDISAESVSYDADTGRVVLRDLAASHGFSQPFTLVTPAYHSPEQARGLTDHRSDLYSLGVLLFRIYTGHLPINASSAAVYRTAHMLEPPLTVPAVRDCHPMFERIVAHLLKKAPDERYLTAAGLKYDMEKLLQLITDDPTDTTTFELGTKEVPFLLTVSNKLIGRTEELSALDKLYNLCLKSNQAGFCSLQGAPGVGKTALVQAFSSQHHNPFFFSFKFNQFGNVPMEAVTHVMNRVLHQTVTSSAFAKKTDREIFLARLRECDVLKALVDLVPAYAKLAPDTPPIPEGLAGTQGILFPAIGHVLTVTQQFCKWPIVLFFDDVQWIDPGTKGLLASLLATAVPILTIVAYRDRSSQTTFTVKSVLPAEPSSALKTADLSLRPFGDENVRELIYSLPLADKDKATLSRTMYVQTEGNPFYLRLRLNMMAATGALTYDVDSHLWRLNPDKVDISVPVTAEDAVEYCQSVLQALDPEVTSVLSRLAMMRQGRTMNEYISTLADEPLLLALTAEKGTTAAELIKHSINVAVQKSLMYRTGVGVSFAHDRLQQSAIRFASEEEAAKIHSYLGHRALEKGPETPQESFQILSHFLTSKGLIEDPSVVLKLGNMAADICQLYITAGSHEALDDLLRFVRGLLDSQSSDVQSATDFQATQLRLLIAHHGILFLMNDLEGAESLFDQIRPRKLTFAEVHDFYHSRIGMLANIGAYTDAITVTAEALSRLDEHSLPKDFVLPDGEPAALVQELRQEIKSLFDDNPGMGAKEIAELIKVSSDEHHNYKTEIMNSLIPVLYLTGKFDLFLYMPAVSCRNILKHGVTSSAGHAFAVLGFGLANLFQDPFGAEVSMIGKYVADRFENNVTKCRAHSVTALSAVHNPDYRDLLLPMLFSAYCAGRTAHDILWACYAALLHTYQALWEGRPLSDAHRQVSELYTYCKANGHQTLARESLRSAQHSIAILRGTRSSEDPTYHYCLPEEDEFKAVPLLMLCHVSSSIVALYCHEQYDLAQKMIDIAVEHGVDLSSPGLPVTSIFQTYSALVAHKLLTRSPSDVAGIDPAYSTDVLMSQLSSNLACLETLQAGSSESTFTPYVLIVRACVIDVRDGSPVGALPVLESVVDWVRSAGCRRHLDLVAIAYMLATSICDRARLSTVRDVYRSKALAALEEWGALAVIGVLQSGQPIEQPLSSSRTSSPVSSSRRMSRQQSSPSLPDSSNQNPSGSGKAPKGPTPVLTRHSSTKHLTSRHGGPDFASVLDCASYISSFHTFEELTTRLSMTVLKLSTASRVVLFTVDPHTQDLEPTADCTIEGLSPAENLRNIRYSSSVLKIAHELHQPLVVHSAQQESPYCFEKYVLESGVCTLASFPIHYRNSLVAVVYLEHGFTPGVFKPAIMETLALVGHHIASAIVNSRLVQDLRERTAQLEQSHAILASAVKVKDTILSNTSHELRSPLNGIIGLNEFILSSDHELPPEVENCMKTTLSMARQLVHIVSDILDMSKIDERALVLNYETASLHSLVKEVLDIASFTSPHLKLVNNISDHLPEVMIDPVRFKQVVFNLVSNAIKFTPKGSVTISAELSTNHDTCIITVADTGIGIEADHLDLIFEPFGQVESYDTRKHEGTGLGLSITKKLVELHGGQIHVASTVGKGTTFQIVLPTIPPEAADDAVSPERRKNLAASPSVRSSAPSSNLERLSFGATRSGDLERNIVDNSSTSSLEVAVSPALRGFARISNQPVGPLTSLPGLPRDGTVLHIPQDEHTDDMDAIDTLSQKVAGLAMATKADRGTVSNDAGSALVSAPNTQVQEGSTVSAEDAPPRSEGSIKTESSVSVSTVPQPVQVDVDVSSEPMNTDPIRVLAVDDNPVNLKVLCNFLLKAKMVVTTAVNGQLFLKKLTGADWRQYDVVLLDWMMPVMDGITACRLLRQRIGPQLLPVMFLTAKSDPSDLAKGFEAGGNDFATKPFNRHEIVARTRYLGHLARVSRSTHCTTHPVVKELLTGDPFWRIQSAVGEQSYFVICFHVLSEEGSPRAVNSSTLLEHFRHNDITRLSCWNFAQLDEGSLTFVARETSTLQVTEFLRLILASWAESELASTSEAPGSSNRVAKPLLSAGVDYQPIKAHLFADQLPMLAAIEASLAGALHLARKGTQHEEIVLSDAARAALKLKS